MYRKSLFCCFSPPRCFASLRIIDVEKPQSELVLTEARLLILFLVSSANAMTLFS